MNARFLGGIVTFIITFVIPFSVHAIGPIVSVQIAPATADVRAGSTQSFTVEGKDANGAGENITANTVFFSHDPRGSMDANVYTAGKSGQQTIVANYNGLTSEAILTVRPGPIAELVVNPDSEPEFIALNASKTFSAEAFDSYDNKVPDVSVTWSIEGSIGSLTTTSDSQATFKATREGSGSLIAQTDEIKLALPITVPKARDATRNTNETPAPISQNGNANTNEATPSDSTTTANSATTESQQSTKACKGWAREAWVWLFILYAAVLWVLLNMIRARRPAWWWIIPLGLTVVALWLYFTYRCYPVFPALPYLILLVGVLGASWYNWQHNKPPSLQ